MSYLNKFEDYDVRTVGVAQVSGLFREADQEITTLKEQLLELEEKISDLEDLNRIPKGYKLVEKLDKMMLIEKI